MSVVSQRLSRIPDVAGAAARENNAVSFGREICAGGLAFTTRLENLQAVDLQRYNPAQSE
jgi:hypothetical protein